VTDVPPSHPEVATQEYGECKQVVAPPKGDVEANDDDERSKPEDLDVTLNPQDVGV